MAIKRSDIEEGNVFGGLGESAKKNQPSIEALEASMDALVQTAKVLKTEMQSLVPKDASSIKRHNDLLKESKTLADARLKGDKLIEQQKRELIKTQQAELRLSEQQKRIEERRQKQAAKKIADTKKQNSAFVQLNARIRALSDAYKDLIIQEGKETRASRKLLAEVLALKKARDRANESLGNHQHKVGQYTKAVSKLRSGLAQLGLAFGVFQLLRGSFTILSDYDEKIADIQKTTGLAAMDARLLSIELLNIDTRSSVTELQDLAVAAGRLGIAEQDILGFVRSADKAFVSLGDDLGGTAEEIATSLGKIAANFGLIEEFGVEGAMERVGSVMNELAANSKAGAGAIFDFTKRLSGVAAVAGISQQDIQALGALFDSTGQSMEVAATTLLKLLPALSSDQKRFAEVAGLTADEFSRILRESPIEALKAVAEGAKSSEGGLDGLVKTLEDFGIKSARSAGIVGILASNTDELTELQRIANEAFAENNSLTDEFNVKNQTITAGIEKLKKEWSKLIIEWDEGNGIGAKLKTTILFLTNNLKTIVKVVVGGLRAWALQKVAMRLFRTEVTATGKVITAGLIPGIFRSIKAMRLSIVAFRAGTFSVKTFSAAIKRIPFVGIISSLFTLIGLFKDWNEETEEQNQALDDEADLLSKNSAEFVQYIRALAQTNADSKERSDLMTEINDKFGTTLQNLSDETAFQNQLNDAVKVFIALQKQKILIQRNQGDINKQLLLQIEAEERILKLTGEINDRRDEGETFESARKRLGIRAAELREFETQLRKANVELDKLGATGLDLLSTTEEGGVGRGRGLDSDDDKKKKEDKTRIDQARKTLKELQKVNTENLLVIENNLRKSGATQLEIDDALISARIDNRQKEAEFALKNFGEFSDEFIKANVELNRALIAEAERFDKEAKDNAKKSSEQASKDLIDNQKRDLKVIEKNLIEEGKTRAEIKSELDAQREIQIQEEIEFRKKRGEDIIDLELELAKLRNEIQIDQDKIELEQLKENADKREEIISSSTDKILELADERISKLNDEMSAAQRQADFFAQLAANGNIDAEQSLAKQQQIQAEALKQQAEIERQKRQVELASSVVLAYNNALGEGKDAPEALQEAILGTAGLTAFIGSLPAFLDGIEDTGTHGRGLDGKGGFLALNHPRERILTKEHNAMIGPGVSNDDVANVMYNYRTEGVRDWAMQPTIDLSELKDELREVKNVNKQIVKAINDKPVPNIELGEISSMAMEILETEKRGNRTTQNRFKVSRG